MEEYIYEKQNSLSKVFCKSVISMFEKENVKTLKIVENDKWQECDKILYNELSCVLREYAKSVDSDIFTDGEYDDIRDNGFLIKKYDKREGEDKRSDVYVESKDCVRVLTYIWFLNDVKDSGMEINGKTITNDVGKMIVFPSTWTYMYRQHESRLSAKYIIIGGIYMDVNKTRT